MICNNNNFNKWEMETVIMVFSNIDNFNLKEISNKIDLIKCI